MQKILLNWHDVSRIVRLKYLSVFQFVVVIVPVYFSIEPILAELVGTNIVRPINMLALYFSALFFLVSSIVFQIRSPRVIRNFESKYDLMKTCIQEAELIYDKFEKTNKSIEEFIEKIDSDSNIQENFEKSFDAALDNFIETSSLMNIRETWDKSLYDRIYSLAVCQFFLLLASLITLYITFIDAPIRVWVALTS